MNFRMLAIDGWVWAMCLVFGAIYWHGHLSLAAEKSKYQMHQLQIEQQLNDAKNTQRLLERQLACCKDERWIELELMSQLGMIPKGSTKIILSTSPKKG